MGGDSTFPELSGDQTPVIGGAEGGLSADSSVGDRNEAITPNPVDLALAQAISGAAAAGRFDILAKLLDELAARRT
jgi:hypothetical protein